MSDQRRTLKRYFKTRAQSKLYLNSKTTFILTTVTSPLTYERHLSGTAATLTLSKTIFSISTQLHSITPFLYAARRQKTSPYRYNHLQRSTHHKQPSSFPETTHALAHSAPSYRHN
jgi:hypothetical protein